MPLERSKKPWGTEIERKKFVIYANDINLLGENIHTVMKNTEHLFVTSKEAGLEGKTEKKR